MARGRVLTKPKSSTVWQRNHLVMPLLSLQSKVFPNLNEPNQLSQLKFSLIKFPELWPHACWILSPIFVHNSIQELKNFPWWLHFSLCEQIFNKPWGSSHHRRFSQILQAQSYRKFPRKQGGERPRSLLPLHRHPHQDIQWEHRNRKARSPPTNEDMTTTNLGWFEERDPTWVLQEHTFSMCKGEGFMLSFWVLDEQKEQKSLTILLV